jgi:hypothetical protein
MEIKYTMDSFFQQLQDVLLAQPIQDVKLSIDGVMYPIGYDSKLVSKVIELFVVEKMKALCNALGIRYQENEVQNRYPDFVVFTDDDRPIAMDIKTSYLKNETNIAGFTLGTYKGYFKERTSTKNSMFPYESFMRHVCICMIYTRTDTGIHSKHVILTDKWRIASRKAGSGNTCNIGSIQNLRMLLKGDTEFTCEDEFNQYWLNKS